MPVSLLQSKTENVTPSRNGHVLFRMNCIAHRRSCDGLPGIEVPKRFPCLRVHGFKRFCIVTEEDESTGRRHRAACGMAPACLNVPPRRLISSKRIRQQDLLVVVALAATGARGIVSLARLEGLRFQNQNTARLQGHEIRHEGLWVEGRRVPIGGPNHPRAYACALCAGLNSSANGASLLVNSGGPVQLFRETRRRKK